MSHDAKAESSPVNVEDLFYSPQPDSTPGPEGDTSSSAETEEVEETAPTSEVGDDTTEETEPSPEKPAKRSNAEKRIAELLAENKRLKQQPARVEPPQVETPKPETKVEELKVPTPGDFETWDAYQKAHGEFVKKQIEAETKRAIDADRAERDKQSRETAGKEAAKKAFDAWTKQVETGVKRHPDFKQKVYDGEGNLKAELPLNDALDNLIPRSSVGYEILYHLATLPAVDAAAIREMQGYDALRFAIKLEAQIQETLQTPPKKQTLRPLRQVNGSGAAPVTKSAEEVFYGSD